MLGPTPDQIKAARAAAGHTQTEAAAAVLSALRTWQCWEAGDRKMPAAMYLLYLLLTGQRSLSDARLQTDVHRRF